MTYQWYLEAPHTEWFINRYWTGYPGGIPVQLAQANDWRTLESFDKTYLNRTSDVKYFLALAIIGIAGFFAYTELMVPPPEQQVCKQIQALCGELTQDELSSCHSDLRDLDSMLGSGTMTRVADCVARSDQCGNAVGCMTTDVGRRAKNGLFQAPGSESSPPAPAGI
ncbi:MAG: hypothetical protein MJE77_01265 [Proteobacteria bacterium]|nr:hypothetical protein [Pseudomonadota bacterium]